MRVSHVCRGCGQDLARRRASRDAATGLPVVACGACGTLSVRWERPRETAASEPAGIETRDVVVLILLAANSAAITALVGWIVDRGRDLGLHRGAGPLPEFVRDRADVLLSLVALALLLGFVTALGFGHWRTRGLAAALAGVTLLIGWWSWLAWGATRGLLAVLGELPFGVPYRRPLVDLAFSSAVWGVTLAVAMIVRRAVLGPVRAPRGRVRGARRLLKRRQPWRVQRA